jgi:hypothetical protein
MGRRNRFILVWCAFGFITLASGFYFGPQMLTYCRLRSVVIRPSDVPPRGWSSVPRQLGDTKASTADGRTMEYYGYRFDVPWKEIDRSWDEERTVEVRFKTGQSVRFYNPQFLQDDLISGNTAKEDRDYFVQAFGTSVRKSKYDQFEAIVSTTPSQWSPFRSRTGFARVYILLDIKGLWFEHNAVSPDIFSFKTKGYRGFEFSGLSHDWQNVVVNLFDETDHRCRIDILGDARSGVRLTQPEINRVLQSFGPRSSQLSIEPGA